MDFSGLSDEQLLQLVKMAMAEALRLRAFQVAPR